ncbi:alcohol dehydrogenase [bacterium BMS3Abin05]|nr:alcohol dehydrogenase [bacterium BMS3Abin05]GBE27366.1 alcohol dehydrogenase [bacterium BMS3Bbin03]HDZ13176.1 zinc-binding alcohol dehydrogenase family protein [Bacteroidota bacterium]
MKAMQFSSPAPIETEPLNYVDVPDPVPGSGEIRIRVKACGVCHTDLHEIEGELPLSKLPLIPGHQIVGIVEQSGVGAARFKIGDRVGVPWLHSTCGTCKYCKSGKENLCEQAKFTGYQVDGGYAQYHIIHQDFAYFLPEGFSDFQAAPLLCAGVVGYRALKLSELKPGQNFGMYGFGATAHVIIQIALHRGCDVYVFTRSREHRELALKLGAKWAGRAEDTPPVKMDSSVIFAPDGGLVPKALRVLDKGGTLALAGIYMTPIPPIDYNTLLYHERTVRSVANATREDAEELLQIAAEIPIHSEVVIFPLKEANKALRMVKESQINGACVLEIP